MNAAFDINEYRGRKAGGLKLMVLNIRTRNILYALAVPPQRAFFGNCLRNSESHSSIAHGFAPG